LGWRWLPGARAGLLGSFPKRILLETRPYKNKTRRMLNWIHKRYCITRTYVLEYTYKSSSWGGEMNGVQRAIFPAIVLGSLVVACIGVACGASLRLAGRAITAQETRDVQPGAAQTAVAQAVAECAWAGGYPKSVRRWCEQIERAAAQSGLARNLLAALMLEESGGDPLALSKDGAVGLLQVMPRDGIAKGFMCQNGPCFAARPSSSELQDPAFNLNYGAGYLAGLMRKTGSLREALKAYGPMGAGYAYADAVMAIQARYAANGD
jgi:hypothetical protein